MFDTISDKNVWYFGTKCMRFYTKTYESFDQNVLDFGPKRMGFWTKMYEIPKIGTKIKNHR